MADGERETASSVWAGRHRVAAPRRPALTRDAIVEAALRIADAEGLAAVSMRRIAAELDARTMSLYHHVARKEDVIALMFDAVAAEVLVPEPLPAGWREAVTLVARRERDVAHRHPWMRGVHGTNIEIGPNMLRHAEQTLAALGELKLSPADALQVSMAVDHYVLGHIVRERRPGATGDPGAAGGTGDRNPVEAIRDSPVFGALVAAGELPFLSAELDAGAPPPADTFEQGLAWLLDGIERDLSDRR